LVGLATTTTALSKLRQLRTGPGAATDAHLASALSLAWFDGPLAAPAHAFLPSPCTSARHVRTELREVMRVADVGGGQRP